ncbi:MAG: sulfatase [Armatimonadota bacterium]|nr:MAG: sulfatase [Armatimonadota bacterium]
MNKRVFAASLVVLGLLAVGSDRYLRWSSRPLPRPMRFVLIVVDSLRADHLGCYGHTGNLTPNMDALAERSLRFDNAIAAGPSTLISNRALLTGLHPDRVIDRENEGLRASAVSLAERFAASGYQTAAFSTHPHITNRFGFAQGFQSFVFRGGDDDAITNMAGKWLASHRRDRFFALVYLLDPHAPYAPQRISSRTRRIAASHRADIAALTQIRPGLLSPAESGTLTAGEVAVLHSLYEDEIREADARVGQLLAALDDRTVVVVLADHGEAWREHGTLGHSHDLNTETVHIPLILGTSGVAPGIVSRIVGTADVAPTLLALAGIEAPGLDGCSLLHQPSVTRHVTSTFARGEVTYGIIGDSITALHRETTAAAKPARPALDRETAEALSAIGYVAH